VLTYLIVTALSAGACGFAVAWLVQASKLAHANATTKSQIDGLQTLIQAFEKDIALERTAVAELRQLHISESRARSAADAIAEQVPQLRGQLDDLQSQIKAHAVRAAELETSLVASQLATKEQRELLDKAQQAFETTFKALSADALRSNNQSFIELAKSSFANLQGEAKSDLDARQLAVDQLVQPIREQLAMVGTKLGDIEVQRVAAYAAVHDQLKTLNEATLPEIRKETGSLVKALRQPMVRGRYGEMQLKRVVEMAGMLDHCDFIEQANRETEDGRLRPDMVVKLPGGRNIVIDAKTPIMAYLEALETSDEDAQRAHMLQHAEQFRRHITALGRKSYWDQFSPTPEMVVMFVPGEVFYSAALQADPTLLESSASEKVVLTTPATLIALLRAVAYGWRHEKLAQNAEEIAKVGRELFDRLSSLAKHWSDVGTGLTRAVDAYNRSTGTLESRVLVSARRLKELKTVAEEAEIVVTKPVELQTRSLQAEELTIPTIQGIQKAANGSHLS
jgi:DNA recombination protein RmuC